MLAVWKSFRKSEGDVEKQVDEALEALQKSAALVDRLESDLKMRMDSVKRLKEEQEKVSKLTQISQEQAVALSELISTTLGRNVQRKRAIALGINIVAGLIVFL
jgi:hypothetical protein